jgi:hypothetical protein
LIKCAKALTDAGLDGIGAVWRWSGGG